jgi:ubiquitin C-terminal hydrolase
MLLKRVSCMTSIYIAQWDFFWDPFSTEISTQKVTCTRCNIITTTEEPFSKLMLKFPQSHHKSDQACTLEELISHHNGPEDIHDEYQCNIYNMLTFARWHSIISQYPKVLCIVLGRRKTNDTIIKLAVKYHLLGLQHNHLNVFKNTKIMLDCNMSSLVLCTTRWIEVKVAIT